MAVGAMVIFAGVLTFCTVANTVVEAGGLKPTQIQAKYEWFKDASSQLDAKAEAITISRAALTDLQESFGKDIKQWPKDARTERTMLTAELRGVMLTYNRLRAEYNSASSKWNWQYFEGEAPLKQNYAEIK